jgi:hypothetical protein
LRVGRDPSQLSRPAFFILFLYVLKRIPASTRTTRKEIEKPKKEIESPRNLREIRHFLRVAKRALRVWKAKKMDKCNDALSYLRSVYQDPLQETFVRMRAAIAALPFEHPKLAVTAVLDGASDFATRLELAIARSARVIEARAEPAKAALAPTDHPGPPMVPDRPFRRS